MFPIKDNVRARGFPVVTTALIAANLVVFLIELRLEPEDLNRFFNDLGVVPARLLNDPLPDDWFKLITSQFLHGGWLHLVGNLIALFIFGDNVEDRLGRWRFLAFYLFCGVAAGLVHAWSAPNSAVPSLGASGAISGVMAAYLVLFPKARVITLVLVLFIPLFFEIPALVWIGTWFVLQLLNGIFVITGVFESYGGVAWWAHLGGFAAGLILVWPLRRQGPQYRADEYWPW